MKTLEVKQRVTRKHRTSSPLNTLRKQSLVRMEGLGKILRQSWRGPRNIQTIMIDLRGR